MLQAPPSSTAALNGGGVEIVSVLGGLHDLVLSCKEVRGKVYQIMFDWLERQNGTNDRNCLG